MKDIKQILNIERDFFKFENMEKNKFGFMKYVLKMYDPPFH